MKNEIFILVKTGKDSYMALHAGWNENKFVMEKHDQIL